jgi:hypothetical protein
MNLSTRLVTGAFGPSLSPGYGFPPYQAATA